MPKMSNLHYTLFYRLLTYSQIQRSEVLDKVAPKNGLNGAAYSPNGLDPVEILTNRTHKCCAYIANKSKYCSRLNSVQAFCDINRDVRATPVSCFLNFKQRISLCACIYVFSDL